MPGQEDHEQGLQTQEQQSQARKEEEQEQKAEERRKRSGIIILKGIFSTEGFTPCRFLETFQTLASSAFLT